MLLSWLAWGLLLHMLQLSFRQATCDNAWWHGTWPFIKTSCTSILNEIRLLFTFQQMRLKFPLRLCILQMLWRLTTKRGSPCNEGIRFNYRIKLVAWGYTFMSVLLIDSCIIAAHLITNLLSPLLFLVKMLLRWMRFCVDLWIFAEQIAILVILWHVLEVSDVVFYLWHFYLEYCYLVNQFADWYLNTWHFSIFKIHSFR